MFYEVVVLFFNTVHNWGDSVVLGQLRDIYRHDLQKLLNWRNQEFIRKVMFNDSLISWDQHLKWYENLIKSNNKISKIFVFNGKDFGLLNINNIDEQNGSCEWGFYIGEKNSHKGAGLLLGFTSLEFIFNNLKMRKLTAKVIESNIISRNFHEKLGFHLDGILRKQIKRSNHYEDVYLYSIFNDEWEKKAVQIKKEIEERFYHIK